MARFGHAFGKLKAIGALFKSSTHRPQDDNALQQRNGSGHSRLDIEVIVDFDLNSEIIDPSQPLSLAPVTVKRKPKKLQKRNPKLAKADEQHKDRGTHKASGKAEVKTEKKKKHQISIHDLNTPLRLGRGKPAEQTLQLSTATTTTTPPGSPPEGEDQNSSPPESESADASSPSEPSPSSEPKHGPSASPEHYDHDIPSSPPGTASLPDGYSTVPLSEGLSTSVHRECDSSPPLSRSLLLLHKTPSIRWDASSSPYSEVPASHLPLSASSPLPEACSSSPYQDYVEPHQMPLGASSPLPETSSSPYEEHIQHHQLPLRITSQLIRRLGEPLAQSQSGSSPLPEGASPTTSDAPSSPYSQDIPADHMPLRADSDLLRRLGVDAPPRIYETPPTPPLRRRSVVARSPISPSDGLRPRTGYTVSPISFIDVSPPEKTSDDLHTAKAPKTASKVNTPVAHTGVSAPQIATTVVSSHTTLMPQPRPICITEAMHVPFVRPRPINGLASQPMGFNRSGRLSPDVDLHVPCIENLRASLRNAEAALREISDSVQSQTHVEDCRQAIGHSKSKGETYVSAVRSTVSVRTETVSKTPGGMSPQKIRAGSQGVDTEGLFIDDGLVREVDPIDRNHAFLGEDESSHESTGTASPALTVRNERPLSRATIASVVSVVSDRTITQESFNNSLRDEKRKAEAKSSHQRVDSGVVMDDDDDTSSTHTQGTPSHSETSLRAHVLNLDERNINFSYQILDMFEEVKEQADLAMALHHTNISRLRKVEEEVAEIANLHTVIAERDAEIADLKQRLENLENAFVGYKSNKVFSGMNAELAGNAVGRIHHALKGDKGKKTTPRRVMEQKENVNASVGVRDQMRVARDYGQEVMEEFNWLKQQIADGVEAVDWANDPEIF